MGNKAPMTTMAKFRRSVPEIPRSRRFVSDALSGCGVEPSDSVMLVVSELITNAVRHGAGEVELRLVVSDDVVRLEVFDDGHANVGAPRHPPEADALGGRGLLLVSEVSERWGSGFDPDGRTWVWAEVTAG